MSELGSIERVCCLELKFGMIGTDAMDIIILKGCSKKVFGRLETMDGTENGVDK